MRIKPSITYAALIFVVLSIVIGCSNDEKISSSEEQKMKDGFAQKNFDPGKLTPEQKAGMEKYGGGLTPKTPAGPSGAPK